MEIVVYDALQLLQISRNSAVVDSQKLVCGSGHVGIVLLALLPFTAEKLEYRIVNRCVLDDGGHDLEKRFAQSRRSTLGNMPVLRFKGA